MGEITRIKEYFSGVETTKEHNGYFFQRRGGADSRDTRNFVRFKEREPDRKKKASEATEINFQIYGKISTCHHEKWIKKASYLPEFWRLRIVLARL